MSDRRLWFPATTKHLYTATLSLERKARDLLGRKFSSLLTLLLWLCIENFHYGIGSSFDVVVVDRLPHFYSSVNFFWWMMTMLSHELLQSWFITKNENMYQLIIPSSSSSSSSPTNSIKFWNETILDGKEETINTNCTVLGPSIPKL